MRPNAFYPASKAAAEMLLRGLAGTYGYSFIVLRYMNVYGPGQTAGVVPAVARSLLSGERPKLTGDGTQAFDFVHIEDCAQANMLSIAAASSGAELNVGSGEATSLNDLVATLGNVLGRRGRARVRRAGLHRAASRRLDRARPRADRLPAAGCAA